MSTDPGDAAVQATLAEQAAATAPPSEVPTIDLSAATPAVADIDALKAQLAAAEQAQAQAAAAVAKAEEDNPAPQVSNGGEINDALRKLHDRLAKVEHALGL